MESFLAALSGHSGWTASQQHKGTHSPDTDDASQAPLAGASLVAATGSLADLLSQEPSTSTTSPTHTQPQPSVSNHQTHSTISASISLPRYLYASTALPAALINAASKAKERGNDAYKKGQNAAAIVEYTKGIQLFIIDSTEDSSSSQISCFSAITMRSQGVGYHGGHHGAGGAGANAGGTGAGCSSHLVAEPRMEAGASGEDPSAVLLATLLSNRSAAYVNEKKLNHAYRDAESVIEIRPEWVKGYFRRGEVLLGMKLYSLAMSDFKSAHERESNSKTIMERIARTQIYIQDIKNGLIMHQLLPGRDLCAKSFLTPIQNLIFNFAVQMKNYIYVIGDAASREVVLVDACWDIDGIIKYCKSENFIIKAAIVTHYHIDHIGGIPPAPYDRWGIRVDGLAKLLKKLPNIPAYIHPLDIPPTLKANPEISESRLKPTTHNQILNIHSTRIKFIHTPGHTPGSQCVLVNDTRLLSGDTLFIGSCGRVDFPDSCVHDLCGSLEVLAGLEDGVVVFPGHAYGGEFTTVGNERARGLLHPLAREAFETEVTRRQVAPT